MTGSSEVFDFTRNIPTKTSAIAAKAKGDFFSAISKIPQSTPSIAVTAASCTEHVATNFEQPRERQGICQIVENLMISNYALIAFFNALLEVSQLVAGTIEVRESHHLLLEVASSVVGEFQENANQKGL